MNISNIYFKRILLITLMFALALSFETASASPKTDAIASAKQVLSQIRKLRRLIGKPGVRQRLADFSGGRSGLTDSDSDGLPDFLEDVEGTDACEGDSDGDGVEDGDESHSGSDPEDGDEGEVELRGNIVAITVNTVTVGNYTFTTYSGTEFEGGASLADFQVGDYVEVEGYSVSGVLTLKKINLED